MPFMSTPTRRTRSACCARAANDQAITAPPRRVDELSSSHLPPSVRGPHRILLNWQARSQGVCQDCLVGPRSGRGCVRRRYGLCAACEAVWAVLGGSPRAATADRMHQRAAITKRPWEICDIVRCARKLGRPRTEAASTLAKKLWVIAANPQRRRRGILHTCRQFSERLCTRLDCAKLALVRGCQRH
jgi:hypothetical protein